MPEGAVYVGRPSLFGNPWDMETAIAYRVPAEDRAGWMVSKYRLEMGHLGLLSDYEFAVSEAKWESVARLPFATMAEYAVGLLSDATALVCWCPLDQPCHADVLIELLS